MTKHLTCKIVCVMENKLNYFFARLEVTNQCHFQCRLLKTNSTSFFKLILSFCTSDKSFVPMIHTMIWFRRNTDHDYYDLLAHYPYIKCVITLSTSHLKTIHKNILITIIISTAKILSYLLPLESLKAAYIQHTNILMFGCK